MPNGWNHRKLRVKGESSLLFRELNGKLIFEMEKNLPLLNNSNNKNGKFIEKMTMYG